jgi:hypothetical protein
MPSSCSRISTLAAFLTLGLLGGCEPHPQCQDFTAVSLKFNRPYFDNYSGSMVVGGKVIVLDGCPSAVEGGDWSGQCAHDGIRLSGPHLVDVPEVTFSLTDADGRPLARDLVVPLGPLHADVSHSGSDICQRFAEVPLEMPTGPTVMIMPAMVDFGPVMVGTSSPPVAVRLSNSSTRASGPPQIIVEGDVGEFLMPRTCSQRIPAQGSCLFEVAFKPTSTGSKHARATIVTSGAVTVSLVGIGVP